MNITNIKIRKEFANRDLKAIVSVIIDNCIALHDIRIVQVSDGRLIAAMPSRKDENGIYRDIVHPIDSETRDKFERIILAAYENYVSLESVMNDEEV